MATKCTKEAMGQIQKLRTRYPWAIVDNDQIVIAVYNYKADAREHAKRDPNNLAMFDASGVIWEVTA